VRIARSGRSREKLERTRAALPRNAHEWPLVVADADDVGALAALVASARVVVSTVGPNAQYGLPLVEACARAGTHYADLTGEVLFVREAIDRCDALARTSGARIVHSCGYDSIPSDLGMLILHELAGESWLTSVSSRRSRAVSAAARWPPSVARWKPCAVIPPRAAWRPIRTHSAPTEWPSLPPCSPPTPPFRAGCPMARGPRPS
jgi:short subunit dehydrogenase-like uncharacterized protein